MHSHSRRDLHPGGGASPQLSLVMPCYNEARCLPDTAPALTEAFRAAGVPFELVLVDNGSTDSTGEVIDSLIRAGHPITKVHVPVNRGYGYGILRGLEACRAPLIGYLCADGQVSAEDVVRTYHLMAGREDRVLAKVRRRFRQDSWKRKVVSIIYNGLMLSAFGWLGAIDINGSPKIFSRRRFDEMRLISWDWFLDPEIVLKAKKLGLRVIEVDVEGYARHSGNSNVRRQTILEFLKNIWRYRFGDELQRWRRELESARGAARGELHSAPWAGIRRASDRRMDGVKVLRQRRFEDARGFLHKVLTASQCDDVVPAGEVYVTAALPGEVKGNHFHRRMGEWFAVVQGEGLLEICDPETGERQEVPLSAASPVTVYVPAGLAHAVVSRGSELLICVAWAEAEHDPADVFPYPVWPAQTVAAASTAPVMAVVG